MNIENVKQGAKMVQDGFAILGGGPLSWYLEQLVGAYEFMMARCCPFQVGDRVLLVRAPSISNTSGWNGAKHFLIPGAAGVVREAMCHADGFSFAVEFDDETWIDDKGRTQPVIPKHTYSFGEGWLVREQEPRT